MKLVPTKLVPLVAVLALAHAFRPGQFSDKQEALFDTKTPIRDTNNLTIAAVDALNQNLREDLEKIAESPYFSLYKVDLSDSLCPFQDDSGLCGNRACAIEPLEDSVPIPHDIRFLGQLRKDSVSHSAPVDSVEICAPEEQSIYRHGGSDYDYCHRDAAGQDAGVWVDLNDNSERFTGYGGPHAHKVWRAVYQENCFGYSGEDYEDGHGIFSPDSAEQNPLVHDDTSRVFPAESQLASLFSGGSSHDRYARQELGGDENRDAMNRESNCVEQRLFYRMLSGMHASISTHLSFDYFNATTKEWDPNLDEFMERVGDYRDRINHLYFDYVLVSRAIAKLQNYLGLLSFSSTCPNVDNRVRNEIHHLGSMIKKGPRGFTESNVFSTPEGQALKEEFRQRVRNVNALMSCVGCERCRLWGKLQTAGYGAALKILFELPENPHSDKEVSSAILSNFRKSELVALIQTFARLSDSIASVEFFRYKLEERLFDVTSLSYQLKLHLGETAAALKFIFRSYIEFPKNIWELFLAYGNVYWNKFIGRPVTYSYVPSYERYDL